MLIFQQRENISGWKYSRVQIGVEFPTGASFPKD